MKKETLKIVIIGGWVGVILIGIFLFIILQPRILKDDLINSNPYLNDKEDYNITLNTDLQKLESPLYVCESNKIPSYLDEFASYIDPLLIKKEDENFVIWKNGDTSVLIYDIDTTELSINLTQYSQKIVFSSIKSFVSNYLDPSIKYSEAKETGDDKLRIYSVNRDIEDQELKTGYGYSDYFQIENSYLIYASVLLAKIEKSKFVVPVISDTEVLENYLSNPLYPKSIVLDTSTIFKEDEYSYESANYDINYNSCTINSLEPELYFSSCNENYISYAYAISGICDIEYENNLYTLPFKGFINAVEPEYVKSVQ